MQFDVEDACFLAVFVHAASTHLVSCCTGDKFTILAEGESDDEEDEGFEGLDTEQIMLP